MNKNDRRFLLRLFFIIGFPFFISGILVARYFPPVIVAEADRIAAMTRYDSAVVLQDNVVGTEVLIEGKISPGNPTEVGNLAAYIIEEQDADSDGNKVWEEIGFSKPWLEIDLADGTASIANNTYRIAQARAFEREGRLRYSGLEVGESIVAIGMLIENGNSPQIAAEFIAPGTQAEYIDSTRWTASFWRNFGLGFAAIGVIMIGAGLYTLTRFWQT